MSALISKLAFCIQELQRCFFQDANHKQSVQVQYLLLSRTQWPRFPTNLVPVHCPIIQESCKMGALFIFKDGKGSPFKNYVYTPCTSDRRPFMPQRRWKRRLHKKQSYDKRYQRCPDCAGSAKTYALPWNVCRLKFITQMSKSCNTFFWKQYGLSTCRTQKIVNTQYINMLLTFQSRLSFVCGNLKISRKRDEK